MRFAYGFVLFLIVTFSTVSKGQRISRVNNGLDIGSGFTTNTYTPTINYYQNLTFGNFRYFGIGWTGRLSGNIIGGNPVFETMGNPFGEEDQISLKKAVVYNAAFGFTVNFDFKFVEIGANVDLLNISLGKASNVLYKIANLENATDSIIKYNNTRIKAYPQMANLMPILTKKSAGNSEAYLRLWINQEVAVKVGYQLLNVVYSSEKTMNHGQKRFVNQIGMPFAALTFQIQN